MDDFPFQYSIGTLLPAIVRDLIHDVFDCMLVTAITMGDNTFRQMPALLRHFDGLADQIGLVLAVTCPARG
jgi:hypothetical protein